MRTIQVRPTCFFLLPILQLAFAGVSRGQNISVTPQLITFPNQGVGTTSGGYGVTLLNNQAGTLSISGIQITAPFSQTNNCASTLGPNQQCTFNVTFSPTARQYYTGALTITDSASNSPQAVSLTGNGVIPVTFSPAQLNFSNQAAGTTSTARTVSVTNNLSTTLAISSIQASAPFAQTNNCGTTLGPGASCTLTVTFSPAAVQSYTGGITVTDSDPSSPQSVTLSGSGVAPVTYTPKLIPFPNQPINSTSTASAVTLTNNQATAISITGIATSAPFAQTNNCGTSLGAGASCTVNVTFAPTAVKYYSSSLTITDNTATSPHVVSVTGNGYLPVKFSPLVISFPQQATGTTSSGYSVTLTNAQPGPLNISSIQTAAPFTQTNNCGTSLPGGQSCTVVVKFGPTNVQYYSGNLTITDDATNSPQVIGLGGNGVVPVATLPKVGGLYFNHQIVDTPSTPQPVTLTNNLSTALVFSGMTSSAVFPFTSNCGDGHGGGTLAAGGSCTIQVSFNPQAVTSYTANLTISENAPGSPLVIPLQGAGIQGKQGPMITVKPPSSCILPNATEQFTAHVTGMSDTSVKWYVNNILNGNSTVGTITSSGLYTAPSTAKSYSIKAVSQSSSVSGSTNVSVTTTPSFGIYPYVASIPVGGQQKFEAQACQVPDTTNVSFTVDNIPGGNGTVGTVSSTGVYTAPMTAGKHTVRVTDATLNKTSGGVVTVFSAITADFGSRGNNTAPVPANMFGYGRGESLRTTDDRSLLTTAGVTVSRMSAQIYNVFKNGPTPDWTKIDPLVATVQASGQKAILQFNQSPPWLIPTTGSCSGNAYAAPTNISQWAQIAAQYVTHMSSTFPGVVQDYEIWNEPNATGMCSTADHLKTYMAIYAAAAPQMKAAAPAGTSIRIGGPVLSGYSQLWLSTLLNDPTTAPYVDFISYHQYFFGASQMQAQWDVYTGDISLYEATQDPSIGAAGVYGRVVAQAAAGKQPGGAQTPIYITEYNTNWAFYEDCCRNDPTYGPLWNALYVTDLLNSVFTSGVTHVPNNIDYFAGSAYPWFCMIGVQDSDSDCLYSVGAVPVPYPQYYAYQLIASPQHLGLSAGGYMAKSISTPTGGGGLATTAFYMASKDAMVIMNPTSTPYSQIAVTFANPGLSGTQGTLHKITNGAQVDTSPISFSVQGTSVTTTINVPPYSVQAVSLP